jgi:CubicO group peptidase (beta-lactamase class C family)
VSFDRLDELIRRQIETDRLPGLAIALVRGDEIVWSRGYGVADLNTNEPNTPQSIFSIQSVTKPIVATALMQHYERAAFDLDAPVNSYLSEFKVQNEWEEEHPVTIRRLLTHTAGFPVDNGGASPAEGGAKTLWEFVASVAKIVRRPGEEMVYANFGYDLAGYLVERFAGEPLDDYLRTHVFGPLGMTASAFGAPLPGTTVVKSYFLSAIDGEQHEARPDHEVLSLARPCGAIVSTVEDLGRFLITHLNGGAYGGARVLKDETVADMQRVHATLASSVGGMGLGFRVTPSGGRTLVCHGGDGVTFTNFLGMYPAERVGVALLINMGRAQSARSVIGSAALRALVGEPLVRQARPQVEQDWSCYTGRYVSNFWGIESVLTVKDGIPSATFEGAFSSRDEGEVSRLYRESGVVRAVDGPFAGFDLSFSAAPDGTPSFFGGLYPFRFARVADVAAAHGPVDEHANLSGAWFGTARSPLGPVPVSLAIAAGIAKVSALSAHDEPIEELAIGRGRLAGAFDVEVPNLGRFRVFLRLAAVDGKLAGKAYARGDFGETPMPTELERAS